MERDSAQDHSQRKRPLYQRIVAVIGVMGIVGGLAWRLVFPWTNRMIDGLLVIALACALVTAVCFSKPNKP